jgi:hypothetical protein
MAAAAPSVDQNDDNAAGEPMQPRAAHSIGAALAGPRVGRLS